MAWLKWKELNLKQQIQIRMQRMHWKPEEFYKFEFYIKKDGEVPKITGGFHRMTDAACIEQMKKYSDIPIYHPEKGDLHGWGPGHSFTFIRD